MPPKRRFLYFPNEKELTKRLDVLKSSFGEHKVDIMMMGLSKSQDDMHVTMSLVGRANESF